MLKKVEVSRLRSWVYRFEKIKMENDLVSKITNNFDYFEILVKGKGISFAKIGKTQEEVIKSAINEIELLVKNKEKN